MPPSPIFIRPASGWMALRGPSRRSNVGEMAGHLATLSPLRLSFTIVIGHGVECSGRAERGERFATRRCEPPRPVRRAGQVASGSAPRGGGLDFHQHATVRHDGHVRAISGVVGEIGSGRTRTNSRGIGTSSSGRWPPCQRSPCSGRLPCAGLPVPACLQAMFCSATVPDGWRRRERAT